MTEFCFQSTKINDNKNKSSDFTIFFSFILSHPLYFSYLIFFSPYLFKLLSFLSPLFFTTSLLVLSLLTTLIPLRSIIKSKDGFFLTAYNTLLEKLHPNLDYEDEESHPIEEFEVYKVVFEIPTIEVREENPVENNKIDEYPVENDKIQEYPVEIFVEKVGKETGEKCESLTMEEQKGGTNPNKVKEEEVKNKLESITTKKRESEANKIPKSGSLKCENDKKLTETFSQTIGMQSNMGSFGSMRREKEWRRTLACKLFEERHNGSNNNMNVNGGTSEEGMDLLWETYETESNKVKSKEGDGIMKKGRKKENKIEELMMVNDDEDEYYDDENGKFCCLQALKLSAGKMNLSMGTKFSKAFKGIGFLQNQVRKHGKKGYK